MRQTFVARARSAALRALNYSPRIERIRGTSHRRSTSLREMLAQMGPSYGTVFTRLDCTPEHGVELLSQTDMFAAEPVGRMVRRDSMAKPERHEVKRLQVLVAGAGTLGETELYGRALIADGRLADKYVGPDSMTLVFHEPGSDESLFAYAFLASPTGVAAIRSTSYGTKILRFRDDLLGSLPIPHADKTVVAHVAGLVRHTVEQREGYLAGLLEARAIIERLPVMIEADRMCAARKSRSVAWTGVMRTLCAWNYASTGGALSYLMKKWNGRLRDVVQPESIFRGGRYQRIPCTTPYGIDFMNQRDVFSIRPVPRRIAAPAVPREWVYVPEHTLLVGGQGTLGEGELFGQVALATPDLATAGISEHLLRIQAKDFAANALLYSFLSTRVGRRLLRSTGVGTKLLSLRQDLVLELPIPELSQSELTEVARALRRASASRSAAATSEAEAFRVVEEEVLPAWLG